MKSGMARGGFGGAPADWGVLALGAASPCFFLLPLPRPLPCSLSSLGAAAILLNFLKLSDWWNSSILLPYSSASLACSASHLARSSAPRASHWTPGFPRPEPFIALAKSCAAGGGFLGSSARYCLLAFSILARRFSASTFLAYILPSLLLLNTTMASS